MGERAQQFDRVIAVTGLKAAGKDTFCAYAERRFGYATVRISDAVRAEAATRRLANPTVLDLQRIGDERKRETSNPGYWAERALHLADQQRARRVLINGIRNPGEIACLQRIVGARCTVVGIVAPTLLRATRFLARAQAGDPRRFEEFLAVDDRDRGIGQPPEGQQVDRCLALVPWPNLLQNDGTAEVFTQRIDRFFASHSHRRQTTVTRLSARTLNSIEYL